MTFAGPVTYNCALTYSAITKYGILCASSVIREGEVCLPEDDYYGNDLDFDDESIYDYPYDYEYEDDYDYESDYDYFDDFDFDEDDEDIYYSVLYLIDSSLVRLWCGL